MKTYRTYQETKDFFEDVAIFAYTLMIYFCLKIIYGLLNDLIIQEAIRTSIIEGAFLLISFHLVRKVIKPKTKFFALGLESFLGYSVSVLAVATVFIFGILFELKIGVVGFWGMVIGILTLIGVICLIIKKRKGNL